MGNFNQKLQNIEEDSDDSQILSVEERLIIAQKRLDYMENKYPKVNISNGIIHKKKTVNNDKKHEQYIRDMLN